MIKMSDTLVGMLKKEEQFIVLIKSFCDLFLLHMRVAFMLSSFFMCKMNSQAKKTSQNRIYEEILSV